MEGNHLSPREFLRARRPERFSDSVVEDRSVLDRSLLEYHLDTLTNRNQDTEFERFARRLAEREICPNLLPQTGPTGGGDSKVDSETYPVADNLSLGWYIGIGREAAYERWAFAFSAKKDWQPKVLSDVKKIAGTHRGYSKAFFMSNQFIPDRTRAQVEDRLRVGHGLDVRILDRSWILDKVFSGHHEALAIEELGLRTEVRKEVNKGPIDLQREKDLEELEKRIGKAIQEGYFGISLVEDCIEAAEISRSLERPRPEVEGRLLRAENVAIKYGTSHQHLVSVYQRAWTAFWWYEDYEMLAKAYDTVEEIANGSCNVYDFELLQNLWFLIIGAINRGKLDRQQIRFEEHTVTLAASLERLSKEVERPSTALQARTLLLLQELALSLPHAPDPKFRELQDVVHQCEGLVGYPLEPLVKILLELGDFVGDSSAYAELFDTIVAVTSKREGEVTAARMLLKRGIQQFNSDKPYEAISFLGRALGRLYKHESRNELIKGLYLCGCAYERVGLLWAARGTVLTAASIATNEFWTQSEITAMQARCYNRMKWLELQLGRLPHLLAWHEVDEAVRNILISQGYKPEQLAHGEKFFDLILGMLLLRADIWQLKEMIKLPDLLDAMNLHCASLALLYALGNEGKLPAEMTADKEQSPYDFFLKLRDQPAGEDLPPHPYLYELRKVTLRSVVLGCHIRMESENTPPCVDLAESILAALESLLSTSLVERMIAREPILTINIQKADFIEGPFGFEMRDREGRPHVEIRCAIFDPHSMSVEAQRQVKDRLFELLTNILMRVFLIRNFKEVSSKLFNDELAMERSINFTSSFVALGNVLGHQPKTNLVAWVRKNARSYSLVRSEEWDAADRLAKQNSKSSDERSQPTPGKGEPPAKLSDPTRIKHTQMETVSLIREALWDQASWSGTAFVFYPANERPPILALMFKDGKAAGQIFSLWRQELGNRDIENRLRITVVRGISKKNPHAYRIVIGSYPTEVDPEDNIKYTIMVSRLNTMEPSTARNLNGFLSNYEAVGEFILAHAVLRDESSTLEPVWNSHIIKRELHVREAWEIGRNDLDSVAIRNDDDPILPPNQKEAPVIELLRWKRQRSDS